MTVHRAGCPHSRLVKRPTLCQTPDQLPTFGTSGTFLASSFLSGKRAGQGGCGVGRVVLPMSTFRGVGVEAEQLEQALLGWVGVGEDALGGAGLCSRWG